MPRGAKVSTEKLSPSAFMRQLRPEFYSDTIDRTTYQLDAPTLGYHLETITARNQTHDFEIFCRKLCERTICPNLKPATGPEGGGDSKVDTETIPLPHTERFAITIRETPEASEPDFTIGEELMTATVHWPKNRLPATYAHQGEVQRMLMSLAASVFAATCFVRDMKATLDRFFRDEAVLDRIAMIAVVEPAVSALSTAASRG